MKQKANRKTHHRRVQLQMVVFLLLFTLLTGWIIYDRMSEQVIRSAFVSDEVNRIRDIYEQEGHIGDAFPTLAFTNEEQGIINEKYTEIETYMNETVDKFIMGVEPLDKFDDYVAQIESMGLADVLAVYQAAYDRYMK